MPFMQGKWVQGQLAEKCTSCCRCWPQVRIQSGKQIWGAAGRIALCSVGLLLLLIPRDPPGGNRASRSQFRWAELPYSPGMGEKTEYQSVLRQLLCHPSASLNYLTLKLREGWSQFTNKRLHTLLQDSLYYQRFFTFLYGTCCLSSKKNHLDLRFFFFNSYFMFPNYTKSRNYSIFKSTIITLVVVLFEEDLKCPCY